MVELLISMDPQTGAVQLQGPLDNAVLCLGLLDMARDLVHERRKQAPERPRLVLPPAAGPLRNGG